jgi:uncharacterized membrane protein HdeD (DUF308 family)
MTAALNAVLSGTVAMASLVAALFFLRFWRQTLDTFFLLFAIAFGLDAASRFVLGLDHISNETEPLYFIPRLVTFGLIIVAIVQKNRPGSRGP